MQKQPLERYTQPCPKGTVLFEEGQPGDRMYVIQSGRVQVIKKVGETRVTIAQLGPGDCVGEMAILDGQPRSADAVVIEDAVLVVLDRGTFEQMVREHGEIAVRIMRKLSQRLREANRTIQNFLAENGSLRAVEFLRALAGQNETAQYRPLPRGTTPQTVAARAGLSLQEAQEVWERLRAAGVIDDAGGQVALAPDATVDDYLRYLDLKQKYDPLTVRELAEMTGLPEDEVHRVVRRVLMSRLETEQSNGLADSYQHFLALKKRFEYLDRV
ncbi:MAG: Crp/Fnr family transcriptional regulator [Myxococcales bacterium]